MRLDRLSLRKFKGVQKLDLKPGGADLNVFGDNATGKTTIVDAFTWLLFGKDSANRADFDIKTLDESGEAEHNVDHYVEAMLTLDDGRTLELRRTFREKWTKPRGKAKREFTGHETEYHVDGVPHKKAEFDKVVASFADEKRFRLLTDPLYFNTVLHWTDRRATLLDACGDVGFADVVASRDELADLEGILDGRTPEAYRKIADGKAKAINKELESIPVRIDEVREGMPDVTGSRADAEAALAEAKAERDRLADEILKAKSGGGGAEVRRQIAELDAKIAETENDIRSTAEAKAREARQELGALEEKTAKLAREANNLGEERAQVHRNFERANADAERLRDQFDKVKAEPSPAIDVAETCPTCGQPLPPSKVAEAREKAIADFNASKAERLERIRSEGREVVSRAEKLEHKLEDLDTALAEAQAAHRAAQKAASEAETRAQALSKAIPDPSDNAAYQRLTTERQELVAKLEELSESSAGAVADLQAKQQEVDGVISERSTAVAQFDHVERDEKRITELEAKESKLASEHEELERHRYLLDEFTRAKVELLTERINSRFEFARFKLFEEQINEGLKETCVTTYKGVPFDSLNHGARLNVGLDIINALTEHFGFAPPVFIDNAESVTKLLPTRGQAIRLVVSADDPKLRIEAA